MPEDQPTLPSTLKRSSKKAQDTYEKTLESAEVSYDGDEQAAHRAAWASVKHSFEKVGDHWEAKDHRGPSDERAKSGGPDATGHDAHGVDVAGSTKAQLLEKAHAVDATVTARMTKAEVGEAIDRANARATRKAREG